MKERTLRQCFRLLWVFMSACVFRSRRLSCSTLFSLAVNKGVVQSCEQHLISNMSFRYCRENSTVCQAASLSFSPGRTGALYRPQVLTVVRLVLCVICYPVYPIHQWIDPRRATGDPHRTPSVPHRTPSVPHRSTSDPHRATTGPPVSPTGPPGTPTGPPVTPTIWVLFRWIILRIIIIIYVGV